MQSSILHTARTNNSKMCMKAEKTLNSQHNVGKKNTKAGSIIITDFKLYYKAEIIKTVGYWHKNRHTDQWKRIENPEMDPQIYSQPIIDKAGSIQWKKDK